MISGLSLDGNGVCVQDGRNAPPTKEHGMFLYRPRHARRPRPRVRILLTFTAFFMALITGSALAQTYTVKPGDTLSEIAQDHKLSSWQGFYQANLGVVGSNPHLIFPGQVLELATETVTTKIRPWVRPQVEAQIRARSSSSHRSSSDYAAGSTVWDRLAKCESGGNWAINTGNGYYGGLQFTLGSWRAAGGSGMPHQASREEQIRVAQNLQRMQGWGAWPTCSRQIGLR